MGTNYYWRGNACDCCGRYDVIHVGKSSAGWVFGWHGVRLVPQPQPSWSCEQDDPIVATWGKSLDSAAAWTELLRSGTGELWDEYGERQDVEEFLEFVASKRQPRPNGDPPMTHLRWRQEEARRGRSHDWEKRDECRADPTGDEVGFYGFS